MAALYAHEEELTVEDLGDLDESAPSSGPWPTEDIDLAALLPLAMSSIAGPIVRHDTTAFAHAARRLQDLTAMCATPGCPFLIHADPADNGGKHCCSKCRDGAGSHGPTCHGLLPRGQ